MEVIQGKREGREKKVRRPINGHHVLLTTALSLVLMGVVSPSSVPAQTLESRVEDLEAHDEILRSRQQVLTGDVNDFKAEVAGATTAIRAEMAAEDAAVKAQVSAIAVPVGGVIAWYGDINSIPENFELCDGNPPTTPGAVFSGNKPNLLQRFVRGAVSSVGATGGQDAILDATTDPHTLTIAEMPSHNHEQGDYDRILKLDGYYTHEATNYSAAEPNLHYAGQLQPKGGGQPHSHGMPGHDNRPKYYELFYIIRVK